MTDTQHWFAFRAYNSQAIYGYGTHDEAWAYREILNTNRTVNMFDWVELSDNEATELKLEENTEAFNLDDELAARKGLR